MNITFEKYIEDVKSQLTCNASDEYRNKNITYGYTDMDIDSNFEFFRVMLKCQISAYKALLYFSDYVGNRIKRGLFKACDGRLINADINGSYNIMKKAVPTVFGTNGIEGVVVHPLIITIKN